ncbi:MAG TPA: hypothetical protein VFZ66_24000 [Herpetosiphonaceae bacterium]
MDDQNTSGDLEMRIIELENQLKELRAAQEAMSGSGQAGEQAAMPYTTGYCGYWYAIPCRPPMSSEQVPGACIPCIPAPCIPCIIAPCIPCAAPCIPCNACRGSGGGTGGGGDRFGGLGS